MGYFSNNNEVIDKDGAVYDIGSFRGAAGFIGDYINEYIPVSNETYGYMDFYMGTIFVSGRADLSSVYEWVFKHLKRCDCDWIYHFPRMYVISPDEICEGLKENEDKTILEYDPSESFQKELEKQERKEETSKLRKELDDVYEKTVEESKRKPLPKEVQAYKNIYKKLPKGWPHQ